MLDRDEYTEAHTRGPGCAFFLAWIAASTIAAAIAAVLLPRVEPATMPSIWLYLGWLPIEGTVIGFAVGGMQGFVLVRYLKRKGTLEWVAATTLGRIARSIVIGTIGLAVGGLRFQYDFAGLIGLWLLYAIIGGVAGLVLGLAQAAVLRRRVHNAGWWVLANIGASAFTFMFADLLAPLVGITMGPILTSITNMIWKAQGNDLAVAIAFNLVINAATGIALIDILRHPTAHAEWQLPMVKERPLPAWLDTTNDPIPPITIGNAPVDNDTAET